MPAMAGCRRWSEMTVQHINVKVFAEPAAVDLANAILVFHRWIQEGAVEELLIDVADYRHVPGGPGVIVVGHEANYSLDLGPEKRLGLLYNCKAVAEGTTQEKLLHAFHSAFEACRRLEEEPDFQSKLHFNAGWCEVVLNDRLLAPNTGETWQALKPEFETFFGNLFRNRSYTLERMGGPRERFGVRVATAEPIDIHSLFAYEDNLARGQRTNGGRCGARRALLVAGGDQEGNGLQWFAYCPQLSAPAPLRLRS